VESNIGESGLKMMPFDNFSPTNIGAVDFLLPTAVLHSRTLGALAFVGVTVGAGATVVVGVGSGSGAGAGAGAGADGTVAVVVKEIASLPAVS
jgi:hypothetical protein